MPMGLICPNCGAPVDAGRGGAIVRCASCGTYFNIAQSRIPAALNVVLLDPGPYKIQVVKVIRDLTGSSLREAVDLIHTGGTVLEGVGDAVARDAQARLEAVGAKVSLE